MTELTFEHSEDWIDKLTGFWFESHHNTAYVLTPSERTAIAVHVLACHDCFRFLEDCDRLEHFLQAQSDEIYKNIPDPDFPAGLPTRLTQLWQEEDAKGKLAYFEQLIRELME